MLPDQTETRVKESPPDVVLLKQAVAAHRSGNKRQARESLAAAAAINPDNELVWLWRASVAAGYREAVSSLERVLELNPLNTKARLWMDKLKRARAAALHKAGLPPDADAPAVSANHDANGVAGRPQPTLVTPAPEAAPVEDDPIRRILAEKSVAAQPGNEPPAAASDTPPTRPVSGLEALERTSFPEGAPATEDELFGDSSTSEETVVEERAVAREAVTAEVVPAEAVTAEVAPTETVQEQPPAATVVEETPASEDAQAQAPAAKLACPVCEASWPEPQRICMQCRAITDLALVDEAPQHEGCDRSSLRAAEKRLRLTLETAPSFDIYRALALVYLNLRQSNDALEQLREALRLQPEHQEVRHAVLALEKRQLILAVDDSKTIQRMISSVLEKERYRVVIAGDGLQALARLDDEMPALILLDVTMPRMDGYQVCKVVSGNEATKHIPVIMLSGKDGFFDKVRGRMVGASVYITKPFDPPSLLRTIRKQMPS